MSVLAMTSAGRFAIDSSIAAPKFLEMINLAALERAGQTPQEFDVASAKSLFNAWTSQERQRWLAGVIMSVATMHGASQFVTTAGARTQTTYFSAPADVGFDEQWFEAGLAMWTQGGDSEMDRLCHEFGDLAQAAFAVRGALDPRDVPALANKLVASLRG